MAPSLAGQKRKSASRDPELAASSARSAPAELDFIDLTADAPAPLRRGGTKASAAASAAAASDSDDDVLIIEDGPPPKRAAAARSRSSSLEIEIVDDLPQHKRPRLSSPASSPVPEPEPAPPAPVDGLYFFDDAPKAVKKKALWSDGSAPSTLVTGAEDGATSVSAATGAESLVLPSHIIVEGAPLAASEDMDVGGADDGGAKPLTEAEVFADDLGKIEFLDGGDDKPVQRYFDVAEDGEPAPTGKQHIVCSVCKERGHVARDCKVVICLTCGARDEHETRNCPVALICFACGGRGHRSKDCPAPRHLRQYRHSGPMCDRCGSDVHPGNNCPTLWRIYSYLSPGDRKQTLATRTKLHAAGGFDGDVLVHNPDDEDDGWCYNCAGDDHYGDDCPEPRVSRAPRPDFSAFSSYNSQNSPFWSGPSTSKRPPRPKRNRPGQGGLQADAGRDLGVPDEMANVGWRGKQREKQRALEYERARKTADGDDDAGSSWFDRPMGGGSSSAAARPDLSIKGKAAAKKADESAKKAKKKNRKERRASGDRPPSRGDDTDDYASFVSGGSGTQLELEYGETSSAAGGNRSRSNLTRSDASSVRGGGGSYNARGKDAPKQFSFKFGGGPPGGGGSSAASNPPASGIRPSTLARMNVEPRHPASPASSAAGGPSSSSSLLSRLEPQGANDGGSSGKGKGKGPASGPVLAPLSRAQLRDLQRKEKERHEEVSSLQARLSGKKGKDWLDSPDRRGAGGGSGTGTPTGSKSRYQGGYR